MEQKKIILAQDEERFLVKRLIKYGTGFEAGIEMVGVRYEVWPVQYQDKYEADIIQEHDGTTMRHYCTLHAEDSDEDMLRVFREFYTK